MSAGLAPVSYTHLDVYKRQVFICGIISIIITLTRVRRMIIDEIPDSLKKAISAGIGIFLTYIGLKNAGLLNFAIDPGTYSVSGKGAAKGLASICLLYTS